LTPAFLILLTFMGARGFSTLDCPDIACVDSVIAHAHESQRLSRLRVFRKDEAAFAEKIGLQPAYAPLIDLQFN